MTIRLQSPPLASTKSMMSLCVPRLRENERVMFLTPPGEGKDIVQRMRMMLSRMRKKLIRAGKRQEYFKLHHTVIPWTEGGKRYDCVVLWRSRGLRHIMTEELERLL